MGSNEHRAGWTGSRAQLQTGSRGGDAGDVSSEGSRDAVEEQEIGPGESDAELPFIPHL